MKALTVQQPWAWAIFHGKDVENRTQAWSYRGPLAIHAGNRWSSRGGSSPLVGALVDEFDPPSTEVFRGGILGVVDLVDVHQANPDCCESPWAEQVYVEHRGVERRQIVHLVLERPRELARPLPCRGSLGLWTPPADALELLEAVAR